MYFPDMNTRDIQQKLSDIRLFLLDLDGTVYVENRLLPGALEFFEKVRETNRQYVFLTNNSSKSAADYLTKLTNLNLPATIDTVFTSGQATALYLSGEKPGARVFLVGTESLKQEFTLHGLYLVTPEDTEADFVVVGFDTELEYWKLTKACAFIDDGVPFLATHPDMVCPVAGKRYIPDCGAMCEMITHATGQKPAKVFGKPDTTIVELLCSQKGIPLRNTAMVGDRLYTDMAMATKAGITSICVLSGETNLDSLQSAPDQPDIVVESIADLTDSL